MSAPLFRGPSLGLSVTDRFGPDLSLTRASFLHLSSLRLVPSGQSRQNQKTFATHIHANVVDISILSIETALHRFRTSKPPTWRTRMRAPKLVLTKRAKRNLGKQPSRKAFRRRKPKNSHRSRKESFPRGGIIFRRKDFAGIYIYIDRHISMCVYDTINIYIYIYVFLIGPSYLEQYSSRFQTGIFKQHTRKPYSDYRESLRARRRSGHPLPPVLAPASRMPLWARGTLGRYCFR